jgi:hypothetical protein
LRNQQFTDVPVSQDRSRTHLFTHHSTLKIPTLKILGAFP